MPDQLLSTHPNPPNPPPHLLRQTTNDRGIFEQMTVPGCAQKSQKTLAALAKRQFGSLERHLCHTLELGRDQRDSHRQWTQSLKPAHLRLYI